MERIGAARAGIKPLIDTARMKNSQRATLRGKRALVWSAVGYMGPHITGGKAPSGQGASLFGGGGHPPMRNPTCFVGVGGEARLKPMFATRLTSLIRQWVETGAVS